MLYKDKITNNGRMVKDNENYRFFEMDDGIKKEALVMGIIIDEKPKQNTHNKIGENSND